MNCICREGRFIYNNNNNTSNGKTTPISNEAILLLLGRHLFVFDFVEEVSKNSIA